MEGGPGSHVGVTGFVWSNNSKGLLKRAVIERYEREHLQGRRFVQRDKAKGYR